MSHFQPQALERGFAGLDQIPEGLIPAVVTHPTGALSERCHGLTQIRAGLLGGVVPTQAAWPPAPLYAPIRDRLLDLGIARFCADEPELVDELLGHILAAVGPLAKQLDAQIQARLDELEALERKRRDAAEKRRSERRRKPRSRPPIDLEALREQATREALEAPELNEDTLQPQWGDRVRAWAEVFDVFGDLGQLLGRGWDLARGLLRQTGWKDVLRIRQQLESLPHLREVIQALGRLQHTEDGPTVSETVFEPVTRLEEELREIRTPHLPGETRGITRSDDLARMLPAESALLGHPKLRLLWHARRAERTLLTYRLEGVDQERHLIEVQDQVERTKERPRPERGPILVAVDTSGSMHGVPEQVAKALVLEALRTAHKEKRACHLYLYSSAEDITEHTLDLSPEGLGRLFAFLGQSFHGGTDIGPVTGRILQRLEREAWAKADVLLVTDGEFPTPRGVLAGVERARAKGVRFHGVLVGNRGRTGLDALCDPIHHFSEWRALL